MIPPGTRIAIVGTRSPSGDICRSIDSLVYALAEARPGIVIISGGAPGVDSLAVMHAREYGLEWKEHLPDKYLPPMFATPRDREIALMRRNGDIVDDCDWLVAFPGPESVGTFDAIGKALRAKKLWEVHRG